MKINIKDFQLQGDGSYMNSVDWFGQVIGVWTHPGAGKNAVLRILSDGTYVHFLAFRDEKVLAAYLEEYPEMQVVATGDELVKRYAEPKKESE